MPRALIHDGHHAHRGRTYNILSPRLVVSFGVTCVAISTWMMSHYTLAPPNAGSSLRCWCRVWGSVVLFVPLATMALSRVPRPKLADAAGLNSCVRFIGGSTGLAILRHSAHSPT